MKGHPCPTLYTSEHEDFRKTARTFYEREVIPHHDQWEQDGIVPRELWLKAGEAGLLCFDVPEEYGGPGVDDFRYNVILSEEQTRAGASGPGFSVHTDIIVPYLTSLATDEQKQRWLPGTVSGEIITAIAMTEPGAGSDLQGVRTTAVDKGDHYLLNGSKTFISNGILADLVIVVARTDPEAGHKGISLLVVERGMEGFERGRNLDKIGLHAQDTAELSFTDVVVPKENLLGEEGQGFIYLMMNLPQERLIIAAQAVAARRGDRRDVPRLRQDPRGLRQADRQVPAQPLPDRRDGDRGQGRARVHQRVHAPSTSTASSPRSTPRWRSGGAPSCRTSWSTRACSSTAATAT